MTGKSLGQIAYEAYGDSRGWATFNGDTMPPWDEQVPSLQEAWEAAGQAVENVVVAER